MMTLASTYYKPLRAGGEQPVPAPTATPVNHHSHLNQQPSVNLAPPVVDQLPEGQPPDIDKNCTLHGLPPLPEQVIVVNSQAALDQIAKHSVTNLRSELGGALLGQAYQHNGRSYVEVLAALPAQNDDHGPVHFTFTADGWAQLHKDRAAHYPELQIVGWFHTHPNLGVFYSSDDVVVHSAAFRQPWHVGLVVDPVRKEACYFGWEGNELAALAGYYEFHDQERRSLVAWKTVKTAVFATAMTAGQPYPYVYNDATGSYVRANDLPELPLWTSYVSLLASVVGLLTIISLVFAVILPQSRQITALQQAVHTFANQPAVNRNLATCADPHLQVYTPISGQQIAAGTAVSFVGTADHPDAIRYRLQGRQAEATTWTDFALTRRDQALGEIMTWETADFPPGLYQLQLTAVDSNNISLPTALPCQLQIELLPAPTE